ncbi:hypothetical protein ACIBKY_55160 [Nonomuraea sp. NPDC050394]|uniref:hypothetical protein n=1 Tax=Nonomuraea sp. NPDC050394 TaxID=3364363 RepID=UPI0037B1373E
MTSRPTCRITFVPDDDDRAEMDCVRTGFHGPFHATATETFTRVPGGALVAPKPATREGG